jgi:hypothetical protein
MQTRHTAFTQLVRQFQYPKSFGQSGYNQLLVPLSRQTSLKFFGFFALLQEVLLMPTPNCEVGCTDTLQNIADMDCHEISIECDCSLIEFKDAFIDIKSPNRQVADVFDLGSLGVLSKDPSMGKC